jgi:hypothetical protein
MNGAEREGWLMMATCVVGCTRPFFPWALLGHVHTTIVNSPQMRLQDCLPIRILDLWSRVPFAAALVHTVHADVSAHLLHSTFIIIIIIDPGESKGAESRRDQRTYTMDKQR